MEPPDGQIVLEEEVDENYEPTDQEIQEYASWLGMDLAKEKVHSLHSSSCTHRAHI